VLDGVPTLHTANGRRIVRIRLGVLLIRTAPHVEAQGPQTERGRYYSANPDTCGRHERSREQRGTTNYCTANQRGDCRVLLDNGPLSRMRFGDRNDAGRAKQLAVAIARLIRALKLRFPLSHARTALVAEVNPALWTTVRAWVETPAARRALLDFAASPHFGH